MSISNFSNYIVICRKGIAICKAILVSTSTSSGGTLCAHTHWQRDICKFLAGLHEVVYPGSYVVPA